MKSVPAESALGLRYRYSKVTCLENILFTAIESADANYAAYDSSFLWPLKKVFSKENFMGFPPAPRFYPNRKETTRAILEVYNDLGALIQSHQSLSSLLSLHPEMPLQEIVATIIFDYLMVLHALQLSQLSLHTLGFKSFYLHIKTDKSITFTFLHFESILPILNNHTYESSSFSKPGDTAPSNLLPHQSLSLLALKDLVHDLCSSSCTDMFKNQLLNDLTPTSASNNSSLYLNIADLLYRYISTFAAGTRVHYLSDIAPKLKPVAPFSPISLNGSSQKSKLNFEFPVSQLAVANFHCEKYLPKYFPARSSIFNTNISFSAPVTKSTSVSNSDIMDSEMDSFSVLLKHMIKSIEGLEYPERSAIAALFDQCRSLFFKLQGTNSVHDAAQTHFLFLTCQLFVVTYVGDSMFNQSNNIHLPTTIVTSTSTAHTTATTTPIITNTAPNSLFDFSQVRSGSPEPLSSYNSMNLSVPIQSHYTFFSTQDSAASSPYYNKSNLLAFEDTSLNKLMKLDSKQEDAHFEGNNEWSGEFQKLSNSLTLVKKVLQLINNTWAPNTQRSNPLYLYYHFQLSKFFEKIEELETKASVYLKNKFLCQEPNAVLDYFRKHRGKEDRKFMDSLLFADQIFSSQENLMICRSLLAHKYESVSQIPSNHGIFYKLFHQKKSASLYLRRHTHDATNQVTNNGRGLRKSEQKTAKNSSFVFYPPQYNSKSYSPNYEAPYFKPIVEEQQHVRKKADFLSRRELNDILKDLPSELKVLEEISNNKQNTSMESNSTLFETNDTAASGSINSPISHFRNVSFFIDSNAAEERQILHPKPFQQDDNSSSSFSSSVNSEGSDSEDVSSMKAKQNFVEYKVPSEENTNLNTREVSEIVDEYYSNMEEISNESKSLVMTYICFYEYEFYSRANMKEIRNAIMMESQSNYDMTLILRKEALIKEAIGKHLMFLTSNFIFTLSTIEVEGTQNLLSKLNLLQEQLTKKSEISSGYLLPSSLEEWKEVLNTHKIGNSHFHGIFSTRVKDITYFIDIYLALTYSSKANPNMRKGGDNDIIKEMMRTGRLNKCIAEDDGLIGEYHLIYVSLKKCVSEIDKVHTVLYPERPNPLEDTRSNASSPSIGSVKQVDVLLNELPHINLSRHESSGNSPTPSPKRFSLINNYIH